MRKYIDLSFLVTILNGSVHAQTGNKGSGIFVPCGKLTVNGYFGSTYKAVTGDYTTTATDFTWHFYRKQVCSVMYFEKIF